MVHGEDGKFRRTETDAIFIRKKPGDKLYMCGLDDLFESADDIREVVIVAKDSSGRCVVCDVEEIDDITSMSNKVSAFIPVEGCFFETPEAALRNAAQEDINYCAPRLDRARQIMSDLDAGKDITSIDFRLGDE